MQTIAAQPGTQGPNGVKPTEPRRRDPAVATSPFDSLLDATRQIARARTLTEVRESPSQMFEPKTTAPADARRLELKTSEAVQTDPRDAAAKNATKTHSQGVAVENSVRRGPASNLQDAPARPVKTAPPTGVPNPSESTSSTEPMVESRDRVSDGTAVETNPPALLGDAPPPARSQRPTESPDPIAVAQPAMGGAEAGSRVARSVGALLGGRPVEEAADVRGTTSPGVDTPPPSAGAKTQRSGTSEAKRSAEPSALPKSTGTADDTTVSSFERLVRSIRLQVGERHSTARMQLDPPELGRMRVDVHFHGDSVELEVRTASESAREVVAGRASELRAALEQQGVRVQRFDVLVEAPIDLGRLSGEKRGRGEPEGSRSATSEIKKRFLSRVGRLDVRG